MVSKLFYNKLFYFKETLQMGKKKKQNEKANNEKQAVKKVKKKSRYFEEQREKLETAVKDINWNTVRQYLETYKIKKNDLINLLEIASEQTAGDKKLGINRNKKIVLELLKLLLKKNKKKVIMELKELNLITLAVNKHNYGAFKGLFEVLFKQPSKESVALIDECLKISVCIGDTTSDRFIAKSLLKKYCSHKNKVDAESGGKSDQTEGMEAIKAREIYHRAIDKGCFGAAWGCVEYHFSTLNGEDLISELENYISRRGDEKREKAEAIKLQIIHHYKQGGKEEQSTKLRQQGYAR